LRGVLHRLGRLQRLLGGAQPTACGTERKVRATDDEHELLMRTGERDVGGE